MTSVRVQQTHPFGDATFARCTADIFDYGALTITSVDTNEVVRQFDPDQWERCTVIGSDGYADFSFANDRILRGEQVVSR